jgi:nitrite reductase/ring-hydroxylating ferredoxin subunit
MTRIGRLEDFAEDASSSLQVGHLDILLVRSGGDLYLYENRCPHAADTLDPLGRSVLSPDGLLLHCQRHGAEFLAQSGECVAGPCQGESLQPVAFTLSNGDIYLD